MINSINFFIYSLDLAVCKFSTRLKINLSVLNSKRDSPSIIHILESGTIDTCLMKPDGYFKCNNSNQKCKSLESIKDIPAPLKIFKSSGLDEHFILYDIANRDDTHSDW